MSKQLLDCLSFATSKCPLSWLRLIFTSISPPVGTCSDGSFLSTCRSFLQSLQKALPRVRKGSALSCSRNIQVFWMDSIKLHLRVAWLAAFVYLRKLVTIYANNFIVVSHSVFIEFWNPASFMTCRIFGSPKILGFKLVNGQSRKGSKQVVEAPPIIV